jgi:septin family protein
MGAASFLAMRAVKAPGYMGDNLDSDASWNAVMAQIEQIIDAMVRDDDKNIDTDSQ